VDTSKINNLMQSGSALVVALGIRVLEAIALWIIGRWLIGFGVERPTGQLCGRRIFVILQPFKVGDFVVAGGVMGTVEEIGLFVTSINALDNIRNIVGNGKIFAEIIQNFSTNPYRRVDLQAQLDHTVDVHKTIALLKANLAQIPNVLKAPAPDVEILTFTLAGPVLAVRPYCSNKDYSQVYFDTNRVIRDTGANAGLPAPEQHFAVRTAAVTQ
jgi:small conductance mechanosensitive channel